MVAEPIRFQHCRWKSYGVPAIKPHECTKKSLNESIRPREDRIDRVARPRIENVNALNHESIDTEKFEDGLGKLVLAVVKVLIDVIERQAARRVRRITLKGAGPSISRITTQHTIITKKLSKTTPKTPNT